MWKISTKRSVDRFELLSNHTHILRANWLTKGANNIIWDALCDLVPFVEFKKREKKSWRRFTPPRLLFTFFKLYKSNYIAQSITYIAPMISHLEKYFSWNLSMLKKANLTLFMWFTIVPNWLSSVAYSAVCYAFIFVTISNNCLLIIYSIFSMSEKKSAENIAHYGARCD